MQVKLTAGFILKAAKPDAGKDRVIYWDEQRPGFGLVVTAGGSRSFVFQYRNGKGESRRASLSGTTKLSAAHKWADIIQGEVAKGIDPVESKRTERARQSKRGKFKTIAEEYIKRESPKVRSMDQRIAILNRLVYPEIGDKVAAKLKRSDIVALLDKTRMSTAPRWRITPSWLCAVYAIGTRLETMNFEARLSEAWGGAIQESELGRGSSRTTKSVPSGRRLTALRGRPAWSSSPNCSSTSC